MKNKIFKIRYKYEWNDINYQNNNEIDLIELIKALWNYAQSVLTEYISFVNQYILNQTNQEV